jgi:hypothetical protein
MTTSIHGAYSTGNDVLRLVDSLSIALQFDATYATTQSAADIHTACVQAYSSSSKCEPFKDVALALHQF